MERGGRTNPGLIDNSSSDNSNSPSLAPQITPTQAGNTNPAIQEPAIGVTITVQDAETRGQALAKVELGEIVNEVIIEDTTIEEKRPTEPSIVEDIRYGKLTGSFICLCIY